MDQQVEDIANFSSTPIMSLDEEEDIKVALQSDATAQDVEDSISSYYTCPDQARTTFNNYKAGYTESTDADLELGDKLLKDRNEKWLVKFKSAHNKYDRIFLAAGNFHFVGSDNLIGMLKSEGFSVKRFSCQ